MLQYLSSAAVMIGALRVNLRAFQSGFIVTFIIFVSVGLKNFVLNEYRLFWQIGLHG